MGKLFSGIRAPSTLGSFLRCLNLGNVRQLHKVHRALLTRLTRHMPLLPGADELAFLDLDSMQKRIYGPAKQGAGFGHTKIQGKSVLVRGLNVLASVISTPLAAPVVAATRLRGGKAGSARGATCPGNLPVRFVDPRVQAGGQPVVTGRFSAWPGLPVVTVTGAEARPAR
jgi:hypothetical protein